MSIESIGRQIAAIRKERGVKQEELANFVGVSTQAVSKWENGGAPDTELLPKIADFFSVSIDSLFARDITEYGDLQKALVQKITDTPEELRLKAVLNYCWDMERALFSESILSMGGRLELDDDSIEDYEKRLSADEQEYSSIMRDYGFTRMGIANRLQYYLLVPEIKDTDKALFNGIDYTAFFKDFSDKAVFESCVFLNKRENGKAFSENLLINNLKIDTDTAKQIIATLKKYRLLYTTQIEMDDEIQTVYTFSPTPSFIALLIFAREIIDPPSRFSYQWSGRKKPYLK